MPPTLDGVLLPGWMERDQAVAFLKDDCHFNVPMSDADLESVWRTYRDRVEQLPSRPASPVQAYPLSADEQQHAANFLAMVRGEGITEFQSVHKVNLRQLAVHQYYVVTERADGYRLQCGDATRWMEECLPTSISTPTVPVKFARQNFHSQAVYELPHAEFFFGPGPAHTLGPVQLLRCVTAMNVGRRVVLWAGYHRSYARVLSTPPTAAEWPALVAFTSNTISPPAGVVGVTHAGPLDFTIFGTRPPTFADFFDDDLRMVVKLRKKQYRLEVQARWTATNEP